MSRPEQTYWRQRVAAIDSEVAALEALIEEMEMNGDQRDVAFWTQRRRALLTERKAIAAMLKQRAAPGPSPSTSSGRSSDPRQTHKKRPRTHAGPDPRQRSPE